MLEWRLFKDMYCPARKNGYKPIDSPRLRTQALILSRNTLRATLAIWTSKNRLQRLRPKKERDFFVECDNKTSKAHCDLALQSMCRNSPCRHRTCNESYIYSATSFLKYPYWFPFGTRTATAIPFKYSFSGNSAASAPISTFICLWDIYIFPESVHIFPPAEKADPSWEYIIRPQTHECGNWDWGPDIPFLWIFVSSFRHFVFAVRS